MDPKDHVHTVQPDTSSTYDVFTTDGSGGGCF